MVAPVLRRSRERKQGSAVEGAAPEPGKVYRVVGDEGLEPPTFCV
jgi:hypothetical protein